MTSFCQLKSEFITLNLSEVRRPSPNSYGMASKLLTTKDTGRSDDDINFVFDCAITFPTACVTSHPYGCSARNAAVGRRF